MLASDHGRDWWGLEIGSKRWALAVMLWFRPCCWLTQRVRWRDGWDFNLGPLSLEWRRR